MKKFLALLLSVLMLLTATAAFAEDGEETTRATTNAVFYKAYTNAVPVGEELVFTPAFNKYIANGEESLDAEKYDTVDFSTVDGEGNVVDGIQVTVPADHEEGAFPVEFTVTAPDAYGTYIYVITENEGLNTHVLYDDEPLYIAVMYQNGGDQPLQVVLFNPGENDAPNVTVTTRTSTSKDNTTGKKDQFDNQYDIGSFTVSKTVTGNASNSADTFMLEITFTSDVELDMVNITMQDDEGNDIPVELDNGEGEPTDYMAKDKPYTITREIGDGERLFFDGIPQGVTVTVVETKQVNCPDLNYYVPTYERLVAVDAETGEETYEAVDEISFTVDSEGPAYKITNTKETEIPTGVELDSIPYIVLMAVAVLGAVAFIVKRRMAAADED